ncbi:MAG: threonine--tRNA ligase [Chlamydiae bacterium]|nr:MAG: threonine--tRNA ligase [Chlamydiota bacterium]
MDFDNPKYREMFRHTASHVLAQAVTELFPEAKLAIGPAIATGFYYDFDVPEPFTPDDLKRIEKQMFKIVNKNLPLEHEVWSREKALDFFKENDQPYKIELIESLGNEEDISIYKQGDFIDLCKGPHLASTGEVKAVKLLSIAGAYWRGDEKKQMLQRIYGTAFPDKQSLKAELTRLEEAKKRDHRKLGTDLELFSFHDEIGPGLAVWHPKGAIIRNEIESFWRAEHYNADYDLVYTPHIGKAELWETSGHLDFYREGMYPAMNIDEHEYFVKPMNCPFHILIYKSKLRSYRELPIRWAELGTVYRYERSGALHGLLRVRGFTQDDAHIICAPDQMESEIDRVLDFCLDMLKVFGFEDLHVYISTRPEGKCVGKPERWEAAQKALQKVVEAKKIPFDIDKGGGAFYGPKIDIKIKDVLQREWQCSTIQLEFKLPERFGMTFIGEDVKEHQPYVIHRALLGAIERFFAVLLENCAGNFPLWLAPEQIRIVPIKDSHVEYGKEILKKLKKRNLRASLDETSRPMGAKIRQSRLEKIPYSVIIGDNEVENSCISVKLQNGKQFQDIYLNDFITQICNERDTRSLKNILLKNTDV